MAEVFLREYGDLTNLVKSVPHKEQRGFFSADVAWTCVDFTSDWVAVGTETGWLYLYDRFEESVKHRLTTKPSDRSPVTKVRLKRSVEYVVAMGTALGFVSIFRLPAPLAGPNVKLHAFGIRDLHHSAVKSFEWSQNAMKLFSGDEDGVVVCTEIDYTTNQSRSYVVCKEPHSIVQLSYAHRTLLVSTRWRTVLCNPDNAMNVTQVGRKDRKTLGSFGSIFVPGSFQPQDAVVYCARPNLSLWKADITGTVSLTVIFKTLAASLDRPFGVSLLPDERPLPPQCPSSAAAVNFSQLFVFNEELILSYFGSGIFVVNPRSGQFVCFHGSLPEIIDVAVQDDEVLLLTKPNNGTLQYLARHAFRTRLPSYLTGIPIQLSTHETKSSSKTVATPDSVASMTKSLIGVLMENVVDAVRDGTSAAEQAEQSAGSPETGEEMKSSPGSDEAGIQNSIPIIKLDPNEIVPLKIEPKPPEHERLMVEMKLPLTCSATNSADKLSEEIVFKPVQKKKVRKKSKLRQTADVISISSGDSAHHDRTPSPVDPGRPSPGHGQAELLRCIRRSASPSLLPTSREPLARPTSLPHSLVDPLCEPEDLQPRSLTILPSERPSSDPPLCPPSGTAVSLGPAVNPEPDAEPDIVSVLRSVDEVEPPSTFQPTGVAADELLSCQSNRAFDVSSGQSLDLSMAEVSSELIDFQKTKLNADFALDQNRDCDDSCREMEDSNSTIKLEEESEIKLEEKMEDDKECNKEAHSDTESQKVEAKTPKGTELSSRVENASVVDNVPGPTSPLDSFVSIYQATSGGKPEESVSEISRSDPKPAAGQPMTSFGIISESLVVEIWTEITAPSSLKCLCLSRMHAWCVDRHDAVYYTSIDGPGKWVKIDRTAQKISVSPNGFILWILSKNSVYTANKICAKSPAGSEWREIIREVKSLSVDDHVAWYSKLNGEVLMQKDLKKERTSFRAIRVPCEHHVTDIFCGRGVVWAITDDLMVLVRIGIRKGREEGSRWEPLERQSSRLVSFSLSFGSGNLVWLMDISGRIWFTSGVTSDNPHGNGIWWEVVIMDDGIACDMPSSGKTWSLWDLPHSLSRSASLVDGGATGDVVATNSNGEVWVNFDKGQSVFASNGSITGHQWEQLTPVGMLSSTKWRRISCSDNEGKVNVWLEQSNGDIFCVSSVASDDRVTEIPPPLFNDAILSLAATSGALWCVTKGGKMFVRSGMSSHCVQGVSWILVDLSQLGNVKVVHLSVSAHNVWAVDSLGNAYLRIGVKPPSNKCINAAWLEIDRVNLPSDTHLAQVVSSPNSSMVWAIDTKKNVYIRAGVSERLPLGTKWMNIPGHSFESIHLSNRHVYGLNAKDNVFVRYGISRTNPFGDFWKRIPGKFRHIAVSSLDDMWAIDRDDRLHQRRTFDLEISADSHRQRLKLLTRHDSADSEWEIIN